MSAKRGRAYQCMRCPYIETKERVIAHSYKHHVSLEGCPFYCTLCLFRSMTRRELKRHVKGYAAHKQRIAALPRHMREEDFLREGSDPYELTIPADMVKLSKEASGQHWDDLKVQRIPQPTKETTPGAIDLTMNTTEKEKPDSEIVYLMENEAEEITVLAPDEVEQYLSEVDNTPLDLRIKRKRDPEVDDHQAKRQCSTSDLETRS